MDKKRIPTGIPGLDPMIEGGFPVGKSYLVTGEPGSGKTIFCMQYILQGLLDGEKAVYVAVDEKPIDIIEGAASLGWELRKYIEEKKLLILDASPYFNARVGKGGGVDVAKTVVDLANYVKRMEATRVVIDPVGPLISSIDTTAPVRSHAGPLSPESVGNDQPVEFLQLWGKFRRARSRRVPGGWGRSLRRRPSTESPYTYSHCAQNARNGP
jgi:hypothetical protein